MDQTDQKEVTKFCLLYKFIGMVESGDMQDPAFKSGMRQLHTTIPEKYLNFLSFRF